MASRIGELSKALSGLVVLGVNITLITLGGSVTLRAQRLLKGARR